MTRVEAENTADRTPVAPSTGTWPAATRRRSNPLLQMTLARLRLFLRDRSAIFWVYVFPMLLLAALGVAFGHRPETRLPVDVVEGPGAKQIAAVLESNGTGVQSSTATPLVDEHPPVNYFDVQTVTLDDGLHRLRTGRSAVLIVPGLIAEESVAAATDAAVDIAWTKFSIDYRYDPSRPESLTVRAAVDDCLQRAAGRGDPLGVHDVVAVEPGGRYVDFVLPGILGLCIMTGGLFGVGMTVVDMRTRHLLKRLVTTPMRKPDFLMSLILARLFFLLSQAVIVLIFARFVFDVAMLGSWWPLMTLVLFGCVAFCGLGLLAACRARTMETASGIVNLITMPMWLLSGIFFSPDRFPAAVQPLVQALPLTPLVSGMRAVMLEAGGFVAVAPQLAVLALWSVLTFVGAILFFRWE
ncbi:MAG: ABC transporter permease [Pirellulales bacterium]|nr:ABC transporter permease [Pirellulales bacterium]